MSTGFVRLPFDGREVDIEYVWLNGDLHDRPTMVFLHEGLGSVSMWRDFPQRVCDRLGVRGLVYSRPGYGRSTPRPDGERWRPDFMHRQAHEVLPALLGELKVTRPWLLGHSDGGSIALLHASRHECAGVIVLAPHIVVEDISVKSIAEAREAYLSTDLRERLGRHHDNPDSAFWGWNDIWLDPAFRSWDIAQDIRTLVCPVLAVQGVDDEYGTLEQIHGIARVVPQTRLLEIPNCRHSPHKDQPQILLDACEHFHRQHQNAHA
jgi:pimeloyl-ACP methyl ester carboxylesterase